MTLTQDWLAAIDGANALAATIEFSRHGLIQHMDPVHAAHVVFEDADPVREFPSWPGKRNFKGKRTGRRTLLASPEFRQLWARHDIAERTGATVVLNHPAVGTLRLDREKLLVSVTDGIMLVIYHAQPGTESAD